MIALGDLNPIDSVRGELQNQIGYFLQGRARISRLMNNPSMQIQGQAQGLYAVQAALEDRFQNEITPKLTKIQSGTYDSSDILTLGGFTASIVKQLNDVGSLERSAGIKNGSGINLDMSTMVLGGVIVVGVAILSGVFFGSRTSQS